MNTLSGIVMMPAGMAGTTTTARQIDAIRATTGARNCVGAIKKKGVAVLVPADRSLAVVAMTAEIRLGANPSLEGGRIVEMTAEMIAEITGLDAKVF